MIELLPRGGEAAGTVVSARPRAAPAAFILPVGSLLIVIFLQELRLLESSASCAHICK